MMVRMKSFLLWRSPKIGALSTMELPEIGALSKMDTSLNCSTSKNSNFKLEGFQHKDLLIFEHFELRRSEIGALSTVTVI